MGCFNESFWKGTGDFQIPLLKPPHPKKGGGGGGGNHSIRGDSHLLHTAGIHPGAKPSCTRSAGWGCLWGRGARPPSAVGDCRREGAWPWAGPSCPSSRLCHLRACYKACGKRGEPWPSFDQVLNPQGTTYCCPLWTDCCDRGRDKEEKVKVILCRTS